MRTRQEALANNTTRDGKLLYAKVTGVKDLVEAGATKTLTFQIPFNFCLFNGAEVVEDVHETINFYVKVPDGQGGFVDSMTEQYGYNVNMGSKIYKREGAYGAKLQAGLILTCDVTNHDTVDHVMGVNFFLHELRDPPEA